MKFLHNWLASLNFLLHFVTFLAVFQSIDCLTYYPSDVKSKGDHLQGNCSESNGRVARISDTSALSNARRVISASEKYWTGLSWHFNHTFRWYRNQMHHADVDQSIVNDWWFCFLVRKRKNGPKMIVKRCDHDTHKFLCENEYSTGLSLRYNVTDAKGSGNQIQRKCAAYGSRKQGARIRDGASLRTALKHINNGLYWTGLSLHLIHGLNWYQNTSLKANISEDITLPSLKRWFCFLASKANDTLEPRRCNESHYYICEKNTSATTRLLTSSPETKATTSSGIVARLTTTSELTTSDAIKVTVSTTVSTSKSEILGTATTLRPTSTTTKTSAFASTTDNGESLITGVETSPANVPAKTATIASNSEVIAPSLTKGLTYMNTVLSKEIPATSFINRKMVLTSTTARVQPSITDNITMYDSKKKKKIARKKLQNSISKIKALNATNKDSLKNATKTASSLFKELKQLQTDKTSSVNVLLATQELESFAIKYGRFHYKENESNIISEEYYSMKIQKIPPHNKDAVVFSVNETKYSANTGWASISLPSTMFKGKDAVVVCIVYNDIKQWLPDEDRVETNDETLANLEIRSRVIAGSVNPKPTGVLEENVTISFSYDKEANEEDKPNCLFWDFSVKSDFNGSWSRRGCSMVKKVNNEITCSCNHLTNFAVLMQVGENKISSDHRAVLEVITYIGCVLSLIGEVLTILAYCALMNLKQEQIQIRLNLVVAIAIAQIAFLAGINASETKGVCVFVAALIHIFYLAGFAWMLFEGVYLYLMVVKVFNTVIRMGVFYAVAWGTPVMIVVLSVVLASSQDGGVQSYVHGDFCWVSFTNSLVWTFVAPVLVVCLVNSILLGLVIHEILKMQSHKTSEMERLRQAAKACAVLFPLLGMTWVFGVLSVTDAGLVFQYIFTILNSLQGFFIFVFHVLRNGDVCAEFNRKKKKWKEKRSIGSSRTTHQQSSDMWTDKAVKSDIYELNDKPSGFDNPLVLHQQRIMTPVDT